MIHTGNEPSSQERWVINNVVVGQVRSARTMEVIEVVSLTGLGVIGSPAREVRDWYLPDGTQIGHWDPSEQSQPVL